MDSWGVLLPRDNCLEPTFLYNRHCFFCSVFLGPCLGKNTSADVPSTSVLSGWHKWVHLARLVGLAVCMAHMKHQRLSFPAPCMALSKTVPASHQGGGFHLSSCLTSLYQAIKMPDNFGKRVKSSSSGRQILKMARAYIVPSVPGPPWKTGCIPLQALTTFITQGFCEQLWGLLQSRISIPSTINLVRNPWQGSCHLERDWRIFIVVCLNWHTTKSPSKYLCL